MKREILFRGKRVDNGEWVVGFYYYSVRYSSHFIKVSVEDENFFSEYDIEVDPETVGQFTGLTDKNGTRIFEGDIVSFEDDTPGIVKWNNKFSCYTCFECDKINNEGEILDWSQLLERHTPFYIIRGNIHDNPEFIK